MENDKFLIKGIIDPTLLEPERIKIIENKTFFISGSMNYRYFKHEFNISLDKEYNDDNDVTLGIEIHLADKTLTIKNNILILFGQYQQEIENCKVDKLIYHAGGSRLIGMIESDTKESRTLLLENLLYKYRGNNIIPDNLSKIAEKPNYTLKREIKYDDCHRVYLEKVIGTDHASYIGYSWYRNFFRLKRLGTIFDTILIENSMDTFMKNDFGYDKMNFIKIDDNYFVSEGNHRTVVSKIIGVPYVDNCHVTIYKTDEEYLELFNEIKNMGIIVNCSKQNTYNINRFSSIDKELDYSWEQFNIELNNGKELSLYGLDEIRYFINYVKGLNNFSLFIALFKKLKSHVKGNSIYQNYIEQYINENITVIYETLNKKAI